MLTRHQGNRFVFLEVGQFKISFVGSIGSVCPTLAPEIPVPMSEHSFLFVFVLWIAFTSKKEKVRSRDRKHFWY